MRKILSLSVLCFFSFAYAGVSLTCNPEIGDGSEVITLNIDSRSIATIRVNGTMDVCKKGAVKGKLVDYGKANLKILCKSGPVKLIQNYDEIYLDITSLKLGLSDTTYICY